MGRGAIILGRPCRTEKVESDRKFSSLTPSLTLKLNPSPGLYHICRKDGKEMNEAEARSNLSSMGNLEKLWEPTAAEQVLYNLPPGGYFLVVSYSAKAKDAAVVSSSIQP